MTAEAPILLDSVLSQLVESAPVGMSVHGTDGRCLVMNEALAAINGIPVADALGRQVGEYLPSLAPDLQQLFDRVTSSGVEICTEVHGETPAQPGKIRWWQTTLRPIDVGKSGRGVAVIVEEITERKAAFEALSASESELRRVFDRIDEGFCVCEMIVDDDGRGVDYRFLDINGLFEEMTGLTDAVGKTALELVPDLEAHWIDRYARVAIGGETIRFEQGSDAMGRWFDVFATPLATPGRFAIVFRDETARRTAQAAEAATAQRYRAMADDLPLMVWMHGPTGEQEFVNNTYCEYFGVDREQTIGHTWHALVHPDDIEHAVSALDEAVADQQDFSTHVRMRDEHGEWRWLESWGRARFDEHGEFIGHLGASADVTERVVAEQALSESMTFLRRVLDSLFTFAAVLTPDGTLIEANRPPLEVAGLSIDDVRGKKFWDCFWWNYDEGIRSDLRAAVERAATGEEVRYDVPVRIAGDRRLWIDFQIKPLRSESGAVTHLIPSGLDITGRIDAERERERFLATEREQRLRAEILEAHAAAISTAVQSRDVAAVTVERVESLVGMDVAAVNVRRGHDIEVFVGRTVRSGAAELRLHLDHDLPGPDAMSRNEPIQCNRRSDILRRFPHLDDAVEHDQLESLLALPLRASDRSVNGALVVGSRDPDAFQGADLSILHEMAQQSGLALERALLHEQLVATHEREHRISVRLQQALLPDRVVEHPDVAIAARYHAAGDRLEVGGDWYDSFEWPTGEIGVIVGDVVGHDLEAAATMGRIRAAVAALAPTLAPDPTDVLNAVQRIARGRDGTKFVTAACTIVDPATGVLHVASAGHPPPLVIGNAGATWLRATACPPLGWSDVVVPPSSRFQLRPGDRVLLYSDGLVERRDEPLDTGLDRLRRECERQTSDGLEAFLARLVETIATDHAADDVVVVTMRWNPGIDHE